MRGLINLGNTCYLNSIVQILVNLDIFERELRNLLLTPPGQSVCPLNRIIKQNERYERSNIGADLLRLILKYRQNEDVTAELSNLAKQLPNLFIVNQGEANPQDQHECLNYILDILHNLLSESIVVNYPTVDPSTEEGRMIDAIFRSYLNQACRVDHEEETRKTSLINRLFGGQLHRATKCLECQTISHSFECFRVLELDVNNDVNSLEDCLKQFISLSRLQGDCSYECDACKRKTSAKTGVSFWMAPKYLFLLLKRYDRGRKKSHNISYPDAVDLTPYFSRIQPAPAIYDLASVACHIGGSHSGHCYSLIKQHDGLYLADDQRIAKIRDLEDSDALILTYERREVVAQNQSNVVANQPVNTQ